MPRIKHKITMQRRQLTGRIRASRDRTLYLAVAAVVAEAAGVTLNQVAEPGTHGRQRAKPVRIARMLALYLTSTEFDVPVRRLGRATGFGYRRCSALCHKAEDMRSDPLFDAICDRVARQLQDLAA